MAGETRYPAAIAVPLLFPASIFSQRLAGKMRREDSQRRATAQNGPFPRRTRPMRIIADSIRDLPELPPAAHRAPPLIDALAAAATLGGPAEAMRQASLRQVPRVGAGRQLLAAALKYA
jgi:hypothetical protein